MNIRQSFRQKISQAVDTLESFAQRSWYVPFISFLAALDNLVLIIPNDGILVSSTMLTPKRWFYIALAVSIGSTIGAVVLAELVQYHGFPWVLEIYPSINESTLWLKTVEFFEEYGLLLVFFVALTPIAQQPAVILAGIAHTPILKLASVIFVGRFIKYLILAYLASHAPKVLNKLWGIKGELKDVGIQLK